MREIQHLINPDEKILWKKIDVVNLGSFSKKKKMERLALSNEEELKKYKQIYVLTTKKWIQKDYHNVKRKPPEVTENIHLLYQEGDIITVRLVDIEIIETSLYRKDFNTIAFHLSQVNFDGAWEYFLGITLPLDEFKELIKMLTGLRIIKKVTRHKSLPVVYYFLDMENRELTVNSDDDNVLYCPYCGHSLTDYTEVVCLKCKKRID